MTIDGLHFKGSLPALVGELKDWINEKRHVKIAIEPDCITVWVSEYDLDDNGAIAGAFILDNGELPTHEGFIAMKKEELRQQIASLGEE